MSTETGKPTLYGTMEESFKIYDLLVEAEGELTPELEARLDEMLKGGKEALDSAASVCRKLKADAQACSEEAARFAKRKASFESNLEKLKERMLLVVDNTFDGKVKTAKNTIWGQFSATSYDIHLEPDVDLNDVEKADPTMVVVAKSLATSVIRERVKAGEVIPVGIEVLESKKRFLQMR